MLSNIRSIVKPSRCFPRLWSFCTRATPPHMTVVPKPVVDGLRCQIQSLRDVLHRSALFPRAQDRLVLQPIEGHATGGEGGLNPSPPSCIYRVPRSRWKRDRPIRGHIALAVSVFSTPLLIAGTAKRKRRREGCSS